MIFTINVDIRCELERFDESTGNRSQCYGVPFTHLHLCTLLRLRVRRQHNAISNDVECRQTHRYTPLRKGPASQLDHSQLAQDVVMCSPQDHGTTVVFFFRLQLCCQQLYAFSHVGQGRGSLQFTAPSSSGTFQNMNRYPYGGSAVARSGCRVTAEAPIYIQASTRTRHTAYTSTSSL
ncbi:hypothetical protein B0T17DRAFT_170781 [Bombardia bombarda]|uniref:Uncharacterized protein n=1 Tax=Bombardia bombarda TaxID=252184 RepID=A0AA39X889_9PEZI|nr:hypothetical protein B0T17DRAFT_170781 [Bombardia bombarda]